VVTDWGRIGRRGEDWGQSRCEEAERVVGR
jgi:hypothetical protein